MVATTVARDCDPTLTFAWRSIALGYSPLCHLQKRLAVQLGFSFEHFDPPRR